MFAQELYFKLIFSKRYCTIVLKKTNDNKRGVNDPLGQTHRPASKDHYFQLKIILFCEILKSGNVMTNLQTELYGRTTCVKLVITTGRDCGSASWINLGLAYILATAFTQGSFRNNLAGKESNKTLVFSSTHPSLAFSTVIGKKELI